MKTGRTCRDCGKPLVEKGKQLCGDCAAAAVAKRKHINYLRRKERLRQLQEKEEGQTEKNKKEKPGIYDESGHMVGREYVTIRITKRIGNLFQELTPEAGSIHEARKEPCYPNAENSNYIIRMAGKLVLIRGSECEGVEI